MKPLYAQTEFDSAASRQSFPLECLYCGSPFFQPKHRIKALIKNNKGGDFCSPRCQALFRFPPVEITCEKCGKPFKKSAYKIKKRYKHHFCSHSCRSIWAARHKNKGTRVSKLERWLQTQLCPLYPFLDFRFNRIDAINAELDIFIPSLGLAFELNGIFHYKPIHGSEKLTAIQANDQRKIHSCVEHNIELHVLDVSCISYFKPQRVIKFLNIIRDIVDSKLSPDSGGADRDRTGDVLVANQVL